MGPYFSSKVNKKLSYSDLGYGESRFQWRFHIKPGGDIMHGLTFLAPIHFSKRFIKKLPEKIFSYHETNTVFVYDFTTDILFHLNHTQKIKNILKLLHNQIMNISQEYFKKYHTHLQIVLLSDHGNSIKKGRFLNFKKRLKRQGLKYGKRIGGKNTITFTSPGMLGFLAIFCEKNEKKRIAEKLKSLEGIDLTCFQQGNTSIIYSKEGQSNSKWDKKKQTYTYKIITGRDPLKLDQRLKFKNQVLNIHQDELFRKTDDHIYPNPLENIRLSLTHLTRSPANIILSLKDGYHHGLSMGKLAFLRGGLWGTHGSLTNNSITGFYMTNYKPGPSSIRPSEIKEWLDMSDYLNSGPFAELMLDPPKAAVLITDHEMKNNKDKNITFKYKISLKTPFGINTYSNLNIFPGDKQIIRQNKYKESILINLPNWHKHLIKDKKFKLEIIKYYIKDQKIYKKVKRKLIFRFTNTFQINHIPQ